MHDIKRDGDIIHNTNPVINVVFEGGGMWLYNCVLNFYILNEKTSFIDHRKEIHRWYILRTNVNIKKYTNLFVNAAIYI